MSKKFLKVVLIIICICLIITTVKFTVSFIKQRNEEKIRQIEQAKIDKILQEVRPTEVPSFELLVISPEYEGACRSKIISDINELNETIKDLVEVEYKPVESRINKFDTLEEFYRTYIVKACHSDERILQYDEEYFKTKSLALFVRGNANEKKIHYYIKNNNKISFVKEPFLRSESKTGCEEYVIDICEIDKDVSRIDNPDEPVKFYSTSLGGTYELPFYYFLFK